MQLNVITSLVNSIIVIEMDFVGFICIIEEENTLCPHVALRKQRRLQYFIAVLDLLDSLCVI